jgi:hypothetical protein
MIRITAAFTTFVLAAYAPAGRAQQANQKTYPSAEQAAQALFSAVLAGDQQGLSLILGGDKEISLTDDKDQDDLDRQGFVEKYQQMHRLVREPGGTILYIGAENWPFPMPLVSKNNAWFFDTGAGVREVLVRRIGANESFAIDVCLGLAKADERDAAALLGNTVPIHGYYFRARPGLGKTDFFIAYPAEYRSSGVMTFIVGHDGAVVERDLGPQTTKVARSMNGYKPDSNWHALQMEEQPAAADHGKP